MAIRTPRPLDPRGGLLTKVADVFTRQQKEDDAAAVAGEQRDFDRQGALLERDLAVRGDARAEAAGLRARGFEEVTTMGLEPRPPALSSTPRRGPLTRESPESQVGVAGQFSLPQREIEGADMRLTERTELRQLPPHRDPSIVHPELMPQPEGGAGAPDFTELDDKLGLPPGTLGGALKTAPGSVISAIGAFNRAEGAEQQQELANVRTAIKASMDALRIRAENQVGNREETEPLFAEIEALAQVLLDITISRDMPASQTLEEVISQVQGLDLTPDEQAVIVTKYFERLQQRQIMFQQFSPKGGRRQPLEPSQ